MGRLGAPLDRPGHGSFRSWKVRVSMGRKSWLALWVFALLAAACTKDREVPKSPDGKPMVSRQANPERVVFETELDVPKDYRSKVKKTDLLIWNLFNESGEVVAAHILPVPIFPTKLVITAKQLFSPVPENAQLLFTARIVKFGDEGKPPQKGQLSVMVGSQPDQSEVVENKAVNQKQLDKFLKKQKISVASPDRLSVGSSIKAEFTPSLM